ncbi:MAG: class I SAM-dependent methyltransferase [Candidatus Omnitrophica bacterium]|nr:class I SAM-dependent methyltransferase [Candidatus Omnitrophota bacterium]
MDNMEVVKKYYQNEEYYKMMEEFHKKYGGVAIEPLGGQLIEKICSELNNAVVLEIGCGEGSIILYFAKKFPNIKFIGTDISEIAIKLAKEKSQDHRNVDFLVDDIQKSKLADGSVDFIIAQSVLEHLSDYRTALKECYRILRLGGLYVY